MSGNTLVLINIGLCVITAFRLFTYTILYEQNTSMKLKEEAWANETVKFVTYRWTYSLRIYFTFRLLATAAICFGGDPLTNELLVYITAILGFFFVKEVWSLDPENTPLSAKQYPIAKTLSAADFVLPVLASTYVVLQ